MKQKAVVTWEWCKTPSFQVPHGVYILLFLGLVVGSIPKKEPKFMSQKKKVWHKALDTWGITGPASCSLFLKASSETYCFSAKSIHLSLYLPMDGRVHSIEAVDDSQPR